MRSSAKANATPMFQTDSAQDLASPMPPLRRGTGRTASTSAPGRCFERHLSARARTGVPYLSTARRSSVVADTTGTDASGPSFTTTSTYIAATTAPPPSSMSTLTGVRRYSSKCPSKRSECSIVVIVVACDNSPPMCVRPTDELKNGTPAANTLRILLSASPIQHLSLLPRLDSCRVISSAVRKQSTPRAARQFGLGYRRSRRRDRWGSPIGCVCRSLTS